MKEWEIFVIAFMGLVGLLLGNWIFGGPEAIAAPPSMGEIIGMPLGAFFSIVTFCVLAYCFHKD